MPLFFTEPYYCTLDQNVNDSRKYGIFGIYWDDETYKIRIAKGSSADVQGLKDGDYIFSINKKNVLGEDLQTISRKLRESGSYVEIGVVRPKTIDANLCKYLCYYYSNYSRAIISIARFRTVSYF